MVLKILIGSVYLVYQKHNYMDQYDIYDGNYEEINDLIDTMRIGNIGDNYVVDIELTPTGFAGIEDTDWVRLVSHDKGVGNAEFRHGVRNDDWVVDNTLTPTGFAGIEDTDWTNIMTIPKV
jgi:hypothetical protein